MASSKEEGAPKSREVAKEKSKFGEKTKKRLDRVREKIEALSDETKKPSLLEKITDILPSLDKDSFEKKEQDSINEIVKDMEDEVNTVVTNEAKSKKTGGKEKKSDINPDHFVKIQKLKSDLTEAKAELEKKGILKTNSKIIKGLDVKIKALFTKKEEADFIAEHDDVSREIAALMFLEATTEDSAVSTKVDQSIEEELSRKMTTAREDVTRFFDNLTNLESNNSRSVKWVAEFGESFVKLQEKAKILEKLLREKKYDEFDVAIVEFNNYQDTAYDRVIKSQREYLVGLDKNKFKTIISVIKDRISNIKVNPTLADLKTALEKSWASLSTKIEDQKDEVFNQNIEVFQKNLEAFLAAAPADIRQEFEERLAGKSVATKKVVPDSKDPVIATKTIDVDAENKRDQKIWKDADKKWKVLQNIFNKMPVAKRFSKDQFVSDRMGIIEETLADAYSAPTPRVFADDMGRFNFAFDLLLSKLEREAPEMKTEFEAQLVGAAPSWEKIVVPKKSVVVEEKIKINEKLVEKTEAAQWVGDRLAELEVLKDLLKRKYSESRWMIKVEGAEQTLKDIKNDLEKKDTLVNDERVKKAVDMLDGLRDSLPAHLHEEYEQRQQGIETKEVKKEREERLKEVEMYEQFLEKIINNYDKKLLQTFSSDIDLIKARLGEWRNNVKNGKLWLEKGLAAKGPLYGLLEKIKEKDSDKTKYIEILNSINEAVAKFREVYSRQEVKSSLSVDTSDTEEDKKKEIAQRKQEVEGHKLNFNRFLIDIAEDGLKEDIKSINEILEEASKNVHDASVYDAHINDYQKKIEALISKADQLSKKTIHTEVKDSGGTPEQKYRLSIYNQDYGLLIGIIDDRNDSALEQRLHKSVLEVENSFVAAETHLDDQTLTTAYEKLRDFIDIIYVESDRTIYQEFRQRLSDIHYPNAAASMPPEPQPHVLSGPAKKGFWTKAKEFGKGLFSKEGAKAVGKASYETVTSLLGIKLVTDLVGWGFGVGDLAQRSKEKKQAELSKENIKIAYYNLLRSFEIAERGLGLDESEQVPKRMAELRSTIESSNLSPEAQEQVWQRLEFIYAKYRENTDKAKEERREEVKRLLDGYLHSKIENVRIAKDALNLALTVSGMSLLRGVMFAGTSLLERAKKSSREYARQASGMVGAKSETAFMAKDVFVNSAIETARALVGKGAKENASGVTRAVDFVKALGTVARGLGIFNLTITGGSAEQNIDNLVRALREKGVVETISDNFVANVERVGHTAANPTEGIERAWDKVAGQEANQSLGRAFETHETQTLDLDQENSSPIDPSDLVSRPGSMSSDLTYAFAAEHGLSQKSYEYLHQFPALAGHPESLNRILESSHVGAGIKSHFTGSKIDNLIEAGGERKAVIFEELVKADKAAAAAFLENQKFNSRHLGYLSEFAGKDGKIDYQKFVENYNPENKKMSLALFRAMQGKENTELANAGFIRAATEDRKGATVRIKDDVIYLGLDKDGKPILSGDGEVQVRETLLKIEGGLQNFTAENLQKAAVFTNDEKLDANANELRAMSGQPFFEGDTKNETDLNDKALFVKMGEEHIDAIKKPIGAGSANLDTYSVSYNKEGNSVYKLTNKASSGPAEVVTGSLINPYPESVESRGELVGKSVASYKADGELVRMEAVNISGENSSKLEVKSEEQNSSPLDSKNQIDVKLVAPSAVDEFMASHKEFSVKSFSDAYKQGVRRFAENLNGSFASNQAAADLFKTKMSNFVQEGRNYITGIEQKNISIQKLEAANKFLEQSSVSPDKALIENLFSNDQDFSVILPPKSEFGAVLMGDHLLRVAQPNSEIDILIYNPDLQFKTIDNGSVLQIINTKTGNVRSLTSQEEILDWALPQVVVSP